MNTTKGTLGLLPKGADAKVPLKYLDADKNPVNLNDLSGIIVRLYYEDDPTNVLQTYDTGTTYEDITFDDAVNGRFHVKIQSSDSETADLGWIIGEVKIAESDSDWDNGVFEDIMKTGRTYKIVPSETTTLSP